jgi:hypothetical protein
MPEQKQCIICGRSFIPNKYRKNSQRVCKSPGCQHRRQLDNLRDWRQNNPNYFKRGRFDASWSRLYSERAKSWRQTHAKEVEEYRQKHKQIYRAYMREYMRRYRERRK